MLVVNLRDKRAASPELVGGKAASLARLLSLHIASPEGFCVTTKAYADHLTALWASVMGRDVPRISRGQSTLDSEDLADLRNCIMEAEIPVELRQNIKDAFEELKKGMQYNPFRAVVRSSATAEDLVGASFAGQYNTYLNIVDEDGIIDRIKQCWASFWSERAYFYRAKKGIDHWNTYMAVVVQELVPAEVAGTLFMANPVTRNVKEAIVEANWGLGELLVSGRVTPDTYYVDIDGDFPTLKKKLIKKKHHMLALNSTPEGGTSEMVIPGDKSGRQVLPDQAILDLVQQGLFLSRSYGHPCDIEWAWYSNHFVILQARPITSLGTSHF